MFNNHCLQSARLRSLNSKIVSSSGSFWTVLEIIFVNIQSKITKITKIVKEKTLASSNSFSYMLILGNYKNQ